jgi:hypothetical protein
MVLPEQDVTHSHDSATAEAPGTADPFLARLEAIAEALDRVASATVSANPVNLDASEAVLASAVASLPSAADLSSSNVVEVRRLLRQIHGALTRCRAVGHATTELVTLSLSAQGVSHGYRPTGVDVQGPRLGRLEVRG